jgi:glutamate dehydrogenase
LPRNRSEAERIACYKSFIGNLLSVTDNLKDGQVVPPNGAMTGGLSST